MQPDVEAVVSEVSAHPAVRSVMRRVQRELGLDGAVMEGRDIANVVFPDADVKIYLQASGRVRAERRASEHAGALPADQVATAVARRDLLDSKTNPFVPTVDASVIDTDDLTVEQVLREALQLVLAATGSDQT
jgi:cytidylate kinase